MSAIAHLLLNPEATLHASDRSWERDIPWETVKHVARNGISSPSRTEKNRLVTEARDPNNIDHYIKVVTDNNPVTRIVTVIRDDSRPFKEAKISQQLITQREHEKNVAGPARTRSKKAEQLAKKRARTPKPKNK